MRPALLLALAPLLAPARTHAPAAEAPFGRVISVELVDGEPRCTIVVEGESLRTVLEELCRPMRWSLEGFEGAQRGAIVSADLRDQPLARALEYLLGSVGLRARLRSTGIAVGEDPARGASPEDLDRLASVAYFEALSDHPGHALAPHARLQLGALEERRGNGAGALEHYLAVPRDYGTSPEVPDALFRAGTLRERMGDWAEASLLFRQLLNVNAAHAFEATARQELARCLVRMDNAGPALNLLAVLDERFPPQSTAEAVDRRMVLAEARLGAGQHVEALRALERIDGADLAADRAAWLHRLRAAAFEGLGMTHEAGRAWLVYADATAGAERDRAIERAASLAAEEGDDLALLFACAQAGDELRGRLAALERRARESLGLAVPATAATQRVSSIKEKLDLAEGELASGKADLALRAIAPVFAERDQLTGDLRIRFDLLWARALAAAEGVCPALGFLRGEREQLEGQAERRKLDVLAASLLEAENRWEEAVGAYEGRY